MKKIAFLIPSILLSMAFVTASCQQPAQDKEAGVKNISAAEFKKMTELKEGVLLDVRTPEEFAEGHIPGAINIDYNSGNFKSEIEKLDKNKSYEIYCRSGKRSRAAADIMNELGFKSVVNLSGGILEWQENGFEVVK